MIYFDFYFLTRANNTKFECDCTISHNTVANVIIIFLFSDKKMHDKIMCVSIDRVNDSMSVWSRNDVLRYVMFVSKNTRVRSVIDLRARFPRLLLLTMFLHLYGKNQSKIDLWTI